MEHLALHSNLTLKEFCNRMEKILSLSEFQFDFENETEWGESIKDDLTLNVSRPYEEGTLSKWDSTVPENCNYSISIMKKNINPKEIKEIGQLIVDELNATVCYHRTWVAPGQNIKREIEIKTSYNN